jgi:shikimate dehydrogenase
MRSKLIQLGLIGGNIAASQAPHLHKLAGRLCGLNIDYQLLIPKERGESFDEVFQACIAQGYRGLNITYPYKEQVFDRVQVSDPAVHAIKAVNTVLFDRQGAQGYNTDYSGFITGYRNTFGDQPARTVCMVGAGGVGKAVGFGLLDLGLSDLRIVEQDLPKAEALADALHSLRPELSIRVTDSVEKAADGAEGLINCTPVGMVGYGGTPLPATLMAGASWAFDAVYTPLDTPFLQAAAAAGLHIMSGYELFFYQGVHAFEHFCGDDFGGQPIDPAALRRALALP